MSASEQFYSGDGTLIVSVESAEVLRRYRAGERNFEAIEVLGESSFRGANLSGANFKKSWLSCVDFTQADLRGVCFDFCNVKCSDFRGADLRGASFREAALCGACVDSSTKLDDVVTDGATHYGAPVDDLRKIIDDELQP